MSTGEIHHIVLDVTDVERAADFYGEALGLPAVGRGLWPGGGATALLRHT